MSEVEFQIIKAIGFVSALVLALGLQRYRPHRALLGSWRTNTGLWAVNTAVMGIVCGGCASTASIWAHNVDAGWLNQAGLNTSWMAIPISIAGLDLGSYLWHRANHLVPTLWRFHQAHHCDSHFTVTTALRFHPGELLIALPVRILIIIGFGLPVEGVIAFEIVFSCANFCEHGNINLSPKLERFLGHALITPALHRRHHSMEPQLLNSNFGTILSLWDRALGSFGNSESSIRIDTGLPGIPDSLGTMQILALPAQRARVPE